MGSNDVAMIKNEIFKMIDKAEMWLKPWLVFNKETMKRIEMATLDVECRFSLENERWCNNYMEGTHGKVKAKVERLADVLKEKADAWKNEVIERSTSIDPRC